MLTAGLTVCALVTLACGGGNASDEGGADQNTGAETTVGAPVSTTAAPSSAVTTATTEAPTTLPPTPSISELGDYSWQVATEAADWDARAGLRVVELDGRLLVLGGRTPNQSTIPGDSVIWADVWASDDEGQTWSRIADDQQNEMWPARAYFQAVTKDEAVYVIGGQNFGLEENPFCALLEAGQKPPPGLGIDPDAPCPEFLPTSEFFNDVWRSTDGVDWEQMTDDAPWEGRAGLSAAVLGDDLYVFGGSQNDDSSIIGAGGPARIYYNDVWRSADGAEWELVTEAAPWEPRAGAAVVVKDDRLYLLGGEDGFTCEPLPDCEAPYFNDVWSTDDGETWTQLTPAAGWSPRPGHMCELVGDQIVCFGGFGLVENPTDMWASADGAEWTLLDAAPWNVSDQAAVKYDFDALTIGDEATGQRIVTVGGDRETFDFTDPENYLRVDNDVWIFALTP